MMPIGDDNRGRRIVPLVTYGLVAINVVVFVVELLQPYPDDFIIRWGAIPAEIMAGRDWITLITSMFLHGGWAHLLGNMVFLWIFGDNVEDALGHVLYLAFYFACGIAASLAQVFLTPAATIPGIGASGAISGVLAAYILMFHTNRVRVLVGYFVTTVPAWVMIGLWILLQFVSGYAALSEAQIGGVAYGAHIGGFLAGLVLALPLRAIAGRPRNYLPPQSGYYG